MVASGRAYFIWLAWFATLAVAAFGCRQPTELTVDVSTTAACADVVSTNLVVGALGDDLENKSASTSTHDCSASGELGSIVLYPSGADDGEVAFKVVTGIKQSADACVGPDYRGCIVARRSLRYQPHTAIVVHVEMDVACLNVPCGELETCKSGSCVPARCADPASCSDQPDATAPDASTSDGEVDAPDDAGRDGDAAPPPDTGPDAIPCPPCGDNQECKAGVCTCKPSPCTAVGQAVCTGPAVRATCAKDSDHCIVPSLESACTGVAVCAEGTCACPAGGCTLGSKRCSADGKAVLVCQLDVPGGCPIFVPSPMPADACNDHQQCVTMGAMATCACNPEAPCLHPGSTCNAATNTQTTCATDDRGCPFLSASVMCSTSHPCMGGACMCPGGSCVIGSAICSATPGHLSPCVNDGTGCGMHGADVACTSPQATCSAGACVCPTVCTLGSRRCGTTAQV
jgi:hypothetical protein